MFNNKFFFLFNNYKMFKATQSGVYVPSKSQSVKPDVVSDVSPMEQIRLLIPSFVGFVDPQESYLKCSVKLNNVRGQPVPDPAAGINSLFRNWICRDGSNTATLETLEDYNAMVGSINHFTEQSSIQHIRELFNGVQETENRAEASLYYGGPPDISAASAAAPQSLKRSTTTPQIQFRPMLGCMSNQVVPVNLMNGLRMSIDTEDTNRALRYLTNDGSDQNKSVKAGTAKALNTDDARTGTAGNGQQWFTMATDISTANGLNLNPFSVDDILYCSLPDNTQEQVLGVIVGFFIAANFINISYVPQRAVGANNGNTHTVTAGTNVVYYKFTDRQIAHTGLLGKTDEGIATGAGTGTLNVLAPTYTLSNIEYLVQSVNPPQAYVEGMLKKATTDQGISMDYLSCDLFRHNQSNKQGIVQAQIPTLATRGKSVISQPLPVDWYRDISKSSLSGVPDKARNYQFVWGSNLIPSRPAELSRYSQELPRNEALHTNELQKALININKVVYNLQKINENFIIARGFNKYGQITNFSEKTLSLRVDYNADAEYTKIFNNYVWSLRRVTIAKGIVSVMN
tara:strand:+ start:2384 stop:4093 length:1710 start_codon:yes stop_codon:yes gene_type:complete